MADHDSTVERELSTDEASAALSTFMARGREAQAAVDEAIGATTELHVGDLVTVGRACLGNPDGARAVIVEVYRLPVGSKSAGTWRERPGWTLLFENGAADGFSPGDCELFRVARVGHEARLARYRFVSMLVLQRDFRGGVFQCVWPASALGGGHEAQS